MCPNVEDKSQIISPYKCKNDEALAVMQNTLNKVDSKIDLLITTNEKLAVQEEKMKHLEDKVNSMSDRLWAVMIIALGAIITSVIQLL